MNQKLTDLQKHWTPVPTTCPSCGWRPGQELLRGLECPYEVLPGWVSCPNCHDGALQNRNEVLALKDAGEVDEANELARLPRRCQYEDQHCRNYEPGGSGGGGGGNKGSGGRGGPDDDERDFKRPEGLEKVVKLENLAERIEVRLPQELVDELKQTAKELECTMSDIFREALAGWRQYLACSPPDTQSTRVKVEFGVTQEQLKFFAQLAKRHGKFRDNQAGTRTRMAYKLLKSWQNT